MRAWVEVAPGVLRLPLQGADVVNVYLLGDLLVDAGGRATARRLLRALTLPGLPRPAAHAVTHAHFDHQGASHAV
ncbi:MAG TPA: MBL fold metallo-hydrolase, partial [Longimicrobiales bacterium]